MLALAVWGIARHSTGSRSAIASAFNGSGQTLIGNCFGEHLLAAIALHYMHYNFCRIYQTLRVYPCDAGGVCGSCVVDSRLGRAATIVLWDAFAFTITQIGR